MITELTTTSLTRMPSIRPSPFQQHWSPAVLQDEDLLNLILNHLDIPSVTALTQSCHLYAIKAELPIKDELYQLQLTNHCQWIIKRHCQKNHLLGCRPLTHLFMASLSGIISLSLLLTSILQYVSLFIPMNILGIIHSHASNIKPFSDYSSYEQFSLVIGMIVMPILFLLFTILSLIYGRHIYRQFGPHSLTLPPLAQTDYATLQHGAQAVELQLPNNGASRQQWQNAQEALQTTLSQNKVSFFRHYAFCVSRSWMVDFSTEANNEEKSCPLDIA